MLHALSIEGFLGSALANGAPRSRRMSAGGLFLDRWQWGAMPALRGLPSSAAPREPSTKPQKSLGFQ
ncbi:MAG: hypothetical protein EBU49_02560 [Proteobacteria bacterium]|nr:hypothetical protein [Pseudomonadota bacterium]